MDVLFERCCGLDIHKRTVVACLVVPGSQGQPMKEVRSFGTMTDELLQLSDWLSANGVTHVAMESTGVYWKPVWNLLEEQFELLLVNARHVKAVSGRKTDAKDGEWLADLLRHGLLRGSFVPDRDQRELRELTRYRTSLTQERSAEVNRLQKTLEGANIKLGDVATDITGLSSRQMLAALAAGQTDAPATNLVMKWLTPVGNSGGRVGCRPPLSRYGDQPLAVSRSGSGRGACCSAATHWRRGR